ncbi:MAG TPA: thymidine kinase [Rubrobacter sp.]|jgi:thymidine kinase|nr:thymidine kinase [Rubrobacter sp.]
MTQTCDPLVEASAQTTGSLILITGSMFSGKTEELIRRVRCALYAHRSAQVFKHTIDTRSENAEIRSHNGVPHKALAVSTSEELLGKVEETTDVVAIEEAQFFDEGIIEVCRRLADAGDEVIAAGLDMDFKGEPFGPVPRLLAEADEVVKLRAICARCGREASRSQRLIDGRPAPVSAPTILIGAKESYEARCRHCHEVPEGVFQYGFPGV